MLETSDGCQSPRNISDGCEDARCRIPPSSYRTAHRHSHGTLTRAVLRPNSCYWLTTREEVSDTIKLDHTRVHITQSRPDTYTLLNSHKIATMSADGGKVSDAEGSDIAWKRWIPPCVTCTVRRALHATYSSPSEHRKFSTDSIDLLECTRPVTTCISWHITAHGLHSDPSVLLIPSYYTIGVDLDSHFQLSSSQISIRNQRWTSH
jgi:hypothetical protein